MSTYNKSDILNFKKHFDIKTQSLLTKNFNVIPYHEKVLTPLIQSSKKNTILNLGEFFENQIFDTANLVNLHKFLEKIGSLNNIILLSEDCNFEKLYEEWCEKRKIKNRVNVIGYPFLFYERAREYLIYFKENYKILRYEDRDELPTKKFMCLMGRTMEDRNSLYYFFKKRDLFDNNYISYLGRRMILPDSGNINLIGIGNSTAETDNLGFYFKDSYFSVIPETELWYASPHSLFFTEKTTKVLYHGHPFIILSSVGALKQLREWGFETFPELFDESYDEIEKPFDRIEFIKKEIMKLITMDEKKLLKLCKSVEDKCIHNKEVLFSLKVIEEKVYKKLSSMCI